VVREQYLETPASPPVPPIDWKQAYVLAPGVRVVLRGPTTVQVGLEPPRSVLVHDAPPGADDVLRRLDGRIPLEAAIRGRQSPLILWDAMLRGLVEAGLVIRTTEPVRHPPHLLAVRVALVHRHGSAMADVILTRRTDSLVVVDGAGEVAPMIAELLVASGVGQVHLRAGRRPGSRVPTSRALVRTQDPAPQLAPSVVVLADDAAHNRITAAHLLFELIPHLPVLTGASRAVAGPLVLPGRSACLACLDRRRQEADPGWPTIADALRTDGPGPPPLLAAAASVLAAEQVLDHIDGVDRPRTVDATLEWRTGSPTARRRSWTPHPDCPCQEGVR
jgi:hypothetical protein